MPNGTQPISIETLLQKQKEEKEAASRVSPLRSPQFVLAGWIILITPPKQPKFLTKAQRAQLALAKRDQEEQERREKEERERKDREALEREAEEFRARDRDRTRESRYGSSGTRRQCLR
jgi:ATP-dependent RNA helicase DDX23/PRP28